MKDRKKRNRCLCSPFQTLLQICPHRDALACSLAFSKKAGTLIHVWISGNRLFAVHFFPVARLRTWISHDTPVTACPTTCTLERNRGRSPYKDSCGCFSMFIRDKIKPTTINFMFSNGRIMWLDPGIGPQL